MAFTAATQWQDVRRILCIRPDNLGDVLMTTPAFRALKTLNPHVTLTLLASQRGLAIAKLLPEIDDVIAFEVPWVKADHGDAGSRAVLTLIETLKAQQFDAAIIFNVFSQNPLPAAMICYLAEIPLRLGYCRENPYHLLTDWLPDYEPFDGIAHEVTRQLKLVEHIGAAVEDTRLALRLQADAGEAIADCLAQGGINPDQPWLVLHPGASETRRQYPIAGYVEAGRALVQQGLQVVITGTSPEKSLCDSAAHAIGAGSASFAGQFSIEQFISLIASAPLLIANNTGPIHIAAAVQTPVVVLYAHTNPQHTPWQVPSRVLYFDVPQAQRSRTPLLVYTHQQTVQQPVRDATPDEIVAAALDLLQVQPTGRAQVLEEKR